MDKLQIPQYRFHYYVQDDKIGEHKQQEEYKNGEKVHSSPNLADSNGDVSVVNYRTDKSSGLPAVTVNIREDVSPFKVSLNSPVYINRQTVASKESNVLRSSPIVVEPINTQEQKSPKSIEIDSRDEYRVIENVSKATQLTEQVNANQTEDRKDDVKDEQITEQIVIQDEGITNTQTEFTIPFKKPNPVNADDFKDNDDEAIKKNIVKAIQNINEDHEQFDPQINFKSVLSDKPLKIISADSMEKERLESYRPNQENSNFKNQQLSNKPLRLFGYNPSIIGSLYDMQTEYNRPSQLQQPPNVNNKGYTASFGIQSDNAKSQTHHDSSGMHFSHQSPTIQTVGHKGNQKSNAPTQTQPLYYYDPNSMVMLPIYTNMIQNTYPFADYKPFSIQPQPAQPLPTQSQLTQLQPPQLQAIQPQRGFNLMHILSGGSFHKGSEQAEGSQQTAVKDKESLIKQESNKLENLKPSETYDKSKPPQTVMFYLNPGETPIDLKSLTSSPVQLAFSQQLQADCNGQNSKEPPTVKADNPLQPIPLCSDCVPALGLLGLPSLKLAAIQQKKSIIAPQVMPIWNGYNVSKLNYLILPSPINK